MSLYREQLRAAVDAVTITSPSDFEWFGERTFRLPAPLRRRLDRGSARQHLVNQLAAQLYTHFYCPGHARPERPGLRPARASTWLALQALAAANTGRGGSDPGWHVVDESGGHLRVRRDDLTLDVDGSDLTAPWAGDRAVGVSLKLPRDLINTFPGFYVAVSDVPWSPAAGMVRMYWNVPSDQGPPLVRLVTKALNEREIGFRFKVLAGTAVRDRADAAVLYVGRAHVEAVWSVAADVLGRVRTAVAVPALTKRLAPGLSVAEDPGAGQSFGMHRSTLVADGIVRGHEAGLRGAPARLSAVLDRLVEQGVDPDAPYLQPGGIDRYPVIDPGRVRSSPGRRTSTADLTPAEALAAASRVGNRLLDLAIWHDGRCAWMGFEAIARGRAATYPTAYRATGPDLYSGTAGIARVLAELHAVTRQPEFAVHAAGAMRQAFDILELVPPSARLGLYTGWTGVACAATRVAAVTADDELLDRAGGLAERLEAVDPSDHEYDLLGGLAGAVIGLLALGSVFGRASVERAVELGGRILTGAARAGTGWSWPSRAFPRQRHLTGLSHGASGVGFALVELFAATGLDAFRQGAEQAFAFERAVFDPAHGNWPDYRRIPGEPARRRSFAVTWCHGAPGIALARLRAHQVLGDPSCLEEAEVAAATTLNTVESALSAAVPEWTACHGLTGNAEVLSLLTAGVGRGGSGARLARRVGLRGIADHLRRPVPWPTGPGEGEDPSLMLGLAGVALYYLRLARPQTPSALLPTPDGLVPPVPALGT